MAIPSDIPVTQEPCEPPSGIYGTANPTSSFLDTQHKLFEVLYLLRDTYEALGKHQCYASHFEAAYWTENRRLQDAVEANKILSHQLEQLQTHISNRGRCRVPDYPNPRPSMHELSAILEEPEPHEDEGDQMLQPNTAEKRMITEDMDAQAGYPYDSKRTQPVGKSPLLRPTDLSQERRESSELNKIEGEEEEEEEEEEEPALKRRRRNEL